MSKNHDNQKRIGKFTNNKRLSLFIRSILFLKRQFRELRLALLFINKYFVVAFISQCLIGVRLILRSMPWGSVGIAYWVIVHMYYKIDFTEIILKKFPNLSLGAQLWVMGIVGLLETAILGGITLLGSYVLWVIFMNKRWPRDFY